MDHPLKTLLVTHPRSTREALRASLNVLPYVANVSIADDLEFAQLLAGDRKIDLIIFDLDCVDAGIESDLESIRSHWPDAHCIVLAKSIEQRRAARAAGADTELMYGFQFWQLETTIETLFPIPLERSFGQPQGVPAFNPVAAMA